MQRQILIVDDHNDLTSELDQALTKAGHRVIKAETCHDAVELGSLARFDVVISDLDSDSDFCYPPDLAEDACRLPNFLPVTSEDEAVKNFKICANNFRHRNFDENELKTIVETTLNYKAQYIDQDKKVRERQERIEFSMPSAISLMHSVLEYLVGRVAKMGVVNPDKSNLYIALDEAFVNAVKHGNQFDTDKLVKITADIFPHEARFIVEDEGAGFDVKSIPDPLDPMNLFKTSGRGVMMIYNIMDEVHYNEKGNRLEMVKKSEPEKMKS